MSPCENLPQELILAIADNLQEDKKSLRAFSLVCKAWTNPARDHLFASLVISTLAGVEKLKDANAMVTWTPFLRHLRLMPMSTGNFQQFWHEGIPFLAGFRTPRLRSLDILCLKWHSLSPDQRSMFLRRFEWIISLKLGLCKDDTPNDVITIICSFPRLRKLSLRPCAYRLPGPFPLSPELHLPERLSTLRILSYNQDYRVVLEWLGSIPEQLSIHHLHLSLFSFLPQDLDAINRFLRALGPSLEVFGCNSRKDLSIDLTGNTHLRCVKFHSCQFSRNSQDVLFAMSILCQIRSRQLEQVAFHNYCQEYKDFAATEWIQMDAMLASPQFPALKDIRISALGYPSDLSALFPTLLPTCHARGIVSHVKPSQWHL